MSTSSKLKKQVRALLLVTVFVLSCFNVFALSAAAADDMVKSYTFADLEKVTEWGVKSGVSDDGVLDLTFEGQYQSSFYAIPADINPAAIDKVVFDVKSGNAGDFAYKLHTQADFDSDNKGGTPVSYGNPEIKATDKDVKYFSLMSLNDGGSLSVSKVTFYLKEVEAAPAGGSQEKTFTFSDLEKVTEWGVTSNISADGVLDIAFEGQYKSSFYKIPDGIKGSSIEKAVFNVTSGNAGDIAYKLHTQADFDSDNKGGTPVSYGNPQVVATGEDVVYLSVMSLNEGSTKVAISDVTFTVNTGASTRGVEQDVPNLKDKFADDLGDDFITGISIVQSEINDENLMGLVKKHFNAVTLGNELKPDANFGYSNDVCPGTEKAELNGETITVPVMDHSRAEAMLDAILKWNTENPENKLKVRGHVLVWHSQTPEWFFHEDYDAKKPDASPEEMTKRQEWYIKTMLTYFTGKDSKYKDLFYGWDVVNEAVSDSTGTYRSDAENSSWWRIYKSNEFIINAFRFANKYAPANVELYYNDYNDSSASKVGAIVQLLKDVKNAEGTRIDAMGMQGHDSINSPTAEQFVDAAKKYAAVVGSVQVTEFDVKASMTYDGTSATRETEYVKQAYHYKAKYDAFKQLKAEGVDISGFTIWGIIDGNSWLQTQAGVGGGTDGTQRQCPLFFDDNYHVKPCYWAIIDPSKLAPITNTVDVFSKEGPAIEFADGKASFIPTWSGSKLTVKVNVIDSTDDGDDDYVTLYIDNDNCKSDDIVPETVSVSRSEGKATADGYTVTLAANIDTSVSALGFDIVVTDGGEDYVFNDTTLNFETSSKYYAEAYLKKSMEISRGTAVVDGELDDAWAAAPEVDLGILLGSKATGTARLLWDDDNLYFFADVNDSILNADNDAVHEKDSFEIFIDENNSKAKTYNAGTKQYRVNYLNEQSFNGENCTAENITSVAKETDTGYVIEAAIKWTEITPSIGSNIGIELQINDADDSGSRIGTASWFDTTGNCWQDPSCYGVASLVEVASAESSNYSVDGAKSNPATGAADTAVAAGVVILAAGLVTVLGKKRK